MISDGPSLWTFIGFGVFLLILLMILKTGKPRRMPTVVQSQGSQQWTDDPVYAENRRKAVAAAFATHIHANSQGSSQ
jgi:hypothetical protein